MLILLLATAVFLKPPFFEENPNPRDSEFEKIILEYPFLKFRDSVRSKIVTVYCGIGRGCGGIFTSFELSNGKKTTVIAQMDLSDSVDFKGVLKFGEFFYKNSNSDTLYVSKDGSQKEFWTFISRDPKDH